MKPLYGDLVKISSVNIKKTLLFAGMLFWLQIVVSQDIVELLKRHQYDLTSDGKEFLLNEAKTASFFLLGELHGEQEIPQLIYSIWPQMQDYGYKHIVAEISPWTAYRLEFGIDSDTITEVLWSKREASFVKTKKESITNPTIWGCDMEEISINMLITDLAKVNRNDSIINNLLNKIKNGYNRKMSPELLRLIKNYRPVRDKKYNGISLYENIVNSLRIDSCRNFRDSKFRAQLLRENLMKQYFLKQYQNMPKGDSKKIMFRYGRNHLHRGYDSRGISTLGNFVTEFAISEGLKSFNVAAFAAGGEYKLLGNTFDADERGDDIAFQFLSEQASHEVTIFDLRPIRIYLHSINKEDRTDLQNSLLYWCDSYDSIICYEKVSPFIRKLK